MQAISAASVTRHGACASTLYQGENRGENRTRNDNLRGEHNQEQNQGREGGGRSGNGNMTGNENEKGRWGETWLGNPPNRYRSGVKDAIKGAMPTANQELQP